MVTSCPPGYRLQSAATSSKLEGYVVSIQAHVKVTLGSQGGHSEHSEKTTHTCEQTAKQTTDSPHGTPLQLTICPGPVHGCQDGQGGHEPRPEPRAGSAASTHVIVAIEAKGPSGFHGTDRHGPHGWQTLHKSHRQSAQLATSPPNGGFALG